MLQQELQDVLHARRASSNRIKAEQRALPVLVVDTVVPLERLRVADVMLDLILELELLDV